MPTMWEACAPRKRFFRPFTGFVRTTGLHTGGYSARSFSVKKPGRIWSRDQEKSWTAMAVSTRCFSASGREG